MNTSHEQTSTHKRPTIGALMPFVTGGFPEQVWRGLMEAAQTHDVNFATLHCGELQVAELEIDNGILKCNRDKDIELCLIV